jgi:hypothetical protein
MTQAREGKVTPPRQLNPRVPRALERICLKALAADPQQRYASAGQMERALRAYLRLPRLVGLAGAAALLAAGVVLAVVLPQWLGSDPATKGGGEVRPAPVQLLAGDLKVRVWSKKDESRRGLEIGRDFAALPVHNGDQIQIEVRLNQPAHVYLLWLDSEAVITPLYPWNDERLTQRDHGAAPPPRASVTELRSPPDQKECTALGWRVGGKSGLETVLLLARREPLPSDFPLAELLGKAPLTPLRDPLEYALRGGDEGQPVASINRGQHRGPEKEAEAIDDPLLQLMGRLRRHFEVIRAVRFAHVGN